MTRPTGATHTNQTKICPVCLRPFANRKKWASRGQWEQIIYCSKACAAKAKHAVK